ncbi:hypothetical protein EVAR_29867_1 [Eumeta japonica]|uniref:Uncharacterized protein n=1 Tax=Eumeta variegata TaxID=151549 RepID=A0A4C1V839_EUMVA|nr:hypothetical protein EVAR_29867_1 [Eumeta japonica]
MIHNAQTQSRVIRTRAAGGRASYCEPGLDRSCLKFIRQSFGRRTQSSCKLLRTNFSSTLVLDPPPTLPVTVPSVMILKLCCSTILSACTASVRRRESEHAAVIIRRHRDATAVNENKQLR